MAKTYQFHLGEYVRSQIEDSTMSKADIARKMGVGKNTLSERFKKRHYGTVFDLLETSEIIGMNLFAPILMVLNKGDFYNEELYTKEEVEALNASVLKLEDRIEELKKEKKELYDLLHKSLDKK